jgi:subtilase family serine protease
VWLLPDPSVKAAQESKVDPSDAIGVGQFVWEETAEEAAGTDTLVFEHSSIGLLARDNPDSQAPSPENVEMYRSASELVLGGSGLDFDLGGPFGATSSLGRLGTANAEFDSQATKTAADLAWFSSSAVAATAFSPMAAAMPVMQSQSMGIMPDVGDAGGDNEPMLIVRGQANPQAGGAAAPYTPAQMRHAYGLDQLSNNGAGVTIAIVDAFDDPNALADLNQFSTDMGLPTFNTRGGPTFTKAAPQGTPRTDQGWALEISLDVQWAHAMAPMANILLVEAKTNSNANLYAAVDYAVNKAAHIVSMSWGSGDSSGESSNDSHFNKSGIAFFAASGDTGGAVIYPSASPYVVSVGGTNLQVDSSGNRIAPESAWSSGGGGVSVGGSQPAYQTSYGLTFGGRATPDVSMNADPNTGVRVLDTAGYQGAKGYFQVGGTSASCPEWAGIAALVDQARSTPLASSDLTNRFDYSAATGSTYASNYFDVTTGSNGFSAGTGYDLATGLGTPVVNHLVPYLISH